MCPLSDKKFRGPGFVRKHILNKHAEKVEEAKKENVSVYFFAPPFRLAKFEFSMCLLQDSRDQLSFQALDLPTPVQVPLWVVSWHS